MFGSDNLRKLLWVLLHHCLSFWSNELVKIIVRIIFLIDLQFAISFLIAFVDEQTCFSQTFIFKSVFILGYNHLLKLSTVYLFLDLIIELARMSD